MGVPGCPELAAWTASMDKVRMVLMQVRSMFFGSMFFRSMFFRSMFFRSMFFRSMFCCTGVRGGTVTTLIQSPFALLFAGRPLWQTKNCGGRREGTGHRSCPLQSLGAVRPPPSGNFRSIDAIFVCVSPAFDLLVPELLLGVRPDPLEPRYPVDGVDRQRIAIDLVIHGQLHRGIDVALFLVATHVYVPVGASVGQAVNQVRIAVEIEDDRLVHGKERIVIRISKPVRMVLAWFQLEEIHDVDETDFYVGELFAQQYGRGQRLLSRNVAGRGHYQIGFHALVVAGPVPDADALGAVLDRGVHI